MHRYHIHFMSINEDSDKANRHTRQVETLDPIEYDTDIEAVQLWAAKEVGAKAAVLLSWQELKGVERPDGKKAGSAGQPKRPHAAKCYSQRLSAEQNAALEQFQALTGSPPMMLEAFEAGEITAEELWRQHVAWVESVCADVSNIRFPADG
ncbi:TPA: hypothetical protein SMN75_005910 [Pseudomonas aeruginosa]|uniref:hypothetical protein n=1 Tax=Pseudomonas aeruginosa TaxID=287 RepID=UPI001914BB11|nr:hypothetical protein [Pseudomonas aeruginosa]MBH4379013.1 hypothetical protein [Pseudomonas aeruginosa]HBN9861139.1 hypothetical protein [Pseudomonas aeruginosa]HBN9886215.1 hypothetical protein [Pseudomonas aeruginosa]HEJ9797546.1 hypothetical protein [Pseudomonas aeruginosa]